MQKPVLGRGLKTLLRGDPIAGTQANPNPQTTENLGAGVTSLIRGTNDKAKVEDPAPPAAATSSEPPPAENPSPDKPLIPRAYYFAADIVLVLLALLIAFKNPGPMTATRTTYCVIVLVLACLCGLGGLMAGRKND